MMILRAGAHKLDDEVMRLREGIRIEHITTGREVGEYLSLYDYDLLVIDWTLPDMLAPEAIRLAREAGHVVPIIVFSGIAPPGDYVPPAAAVMALDAGADDYIEMPASHQEIVARAHAVVRRNHGHAVALIRVGDVALDLDRHKVTVAGKNLSVSRIEFATLELLFLQQNVVLNKYAFLNHIYTKINEPSEKAIDVVICRIRKKLAVAGVPELIQTIWGCGYILGDATMVELSAA